MRWARADVPRGAEGWLSADERLRLEGLTGHEQRLRFVAGHAFIRQVVGARCGVAPSAVRITQRCSWCGGPHGKPAVTLPDGIALPPRVSLAHAGPLVIVALSDDPVGIDVERQAGVRDRFGDLGLSSRERTDLERFAMRDRPLALTRWWVRKRAVIKASTIADRVDLACIEVTAPDVHPAVVASAVELGGPIQLYDVEFDAGESFDAALAIRSSTFVSFDLGPFGT